MPVVCTLTQATCHFCRSALVRVTEPEGADRLICPICWAVGGYEAVLREGAPLQRGVRIEREIRYLVDKSRFPKRRAAAESAGTDVGGRSA